MVIFQIILTELPLSQEKVALEKKFLKSSYDDQYFTKL